MSRLRFICAGFILIFVLTYLFRFPGALAHNYSRYLYVLLPIAVLGWSVGLGHADRRIRRASLAAGALAAIQVAVFASPNIAFYAGQVRTLSRDNAAMAEWVAKNLPPDAVVMVHDAGRISLSGNQPLVDLVGLKSPFSADVHRGATYARCERTPSAISDIARRSGAGFIVVTTDWDRIFGLTESLARTGWKVARADTERGDAFYRVYRISR